MSLKGISDVTESYAEPHLQWCQKLAHVREDGVRRHPMEFI